MSEQDNLKALPVWTDQYSKKRPIYVDFTDCVAKLLEEICDRNGIEVSQIEFRTKGIESFDEKIQRKSYNNPLVEIHDFSGIRVICYFKEGVNKLCSILKEEFYVDPLHSVDKIQKHDQLGYQSRHLIVSLKDPRLSLVEYERFKELRAEVQIRTIAQHAWASIARKYGYKNEEGIPESALRRLYRISAVLELCDEEFSTFREDVSLLRSNLDYYIDGGRFSIEINIESLKAYMRSDAENYEALTKALRDCGLRFAQRDRTPDTLFDNAVTALRDAGLTSVEALDRALRTDRDWIVKPISEIFADVDGLISQPFLLTVFAALHLNRHEIDKIVKLYRDRRIPRSG